MLLVIVVVGVLLWLDPSALFSRSDPELPWNQEFRILGRGEQAEKPSPKQPNITRTLLFSADAEQAGDARGQIELVIGPDGTVEGGWSAEYNPSDKFNYLVMGASFKGNTDPSKIYSDEYGEDASQLYFITKGRFTILETNLENNRVRKVSGRIYVTGWLDTEYNAAGEITITSNKKSFQAFNWKAKPSENRMIFDFTK
jgi:hypothetical protein